MSLLLFLLPTPDFLDCIPASHPVVSLENVQLVGFWGSTNVKMTGHSCVVPDDHKPQAVAASLSGLERGGGVKWRPTDALVVCVCVCVGGVSWGFKLLFLDGSWLCSLLSWWLARTAYPRSLPLTPVLHLCYLVTAGVQTDLVFEALESRWVEMPVFCERNWI